MKNKIQKKRKNSFLDNFIKDRCYITRLSDMRLPINRS